MGLPGVLSAMRQIILDLRELPHDQAQRAALYHQLFPNLSTHEVEDLAAIEEKYWRRYTHSIFAGERNILTRYFEVTFALLRRHWQEFSTEPFNSLELTRDIHTKRPWQSHASLRLAECLLEYLTRDRADITTRYPAIKAMAELEIVAVELRSARDDHYGPYDSLTAEDFAKTTVGELMMSDYYLPSSLRFRTFSINAPELRASYYRNGETLPTDIPPSPTSAIAARNRDGFVRWITVPEPLYRFLEAQPRTTRLQLETLAEAFTQTLDQDLSDEAMFGRFYRFLQELISAGTVIFLAPEISSPAGPKDSTSPSKKPHP
jgi:hypothetical protein